MPLTRDRSTDTIANKIPLLVTKCLASVGLLLGFVKYDDMDQWLMDFQV